MKELVLYLASSLVDDKDGVAVTEEQTSGEITLKLHVRRDDLGKVIGKKGRVAKAMRALVAAAGARQNKRIVLEIVEPANEAPSSNANEREASSAAI